MPTDVQLPFKSYASVLRERLGGRVYKVGLDARLTCPNIDGTVARGGCTFCTNPSFSFQPMDSVSRRRDLRTQLRSGIDYYHRTRGATRFLAYFQTFTNTYAPPAQLRELYDEVLGESGVIGLAISTRPDAVPEPVIDVLEEFSEKTYLTIEMGLQTANDATLLRINRGHTLADFQDAMARLTRRGLKVKVHLLFGLPGDGLPEAIHSIHVVNESGAEGVKLHHLQVLKGTRLGRDYLKEPFRVFTFAEYRDTILEVIAELHPELYVDRLFATCRRGLVLAPDFAMNSQELRNALVQAMLQAGVTQGCKSRSRHLGSPGDSAAPSQMEPGPRATS